MLAPATLDRIADIVADQQPGPDHRHRRRLRHVRARVPFADGRPAREHDRDLLVLEVLRRHRAGGSASSRSTATTCSTGRSPRCRPTRLDDARLPLRVDLHRDARHPLHRPDGRRQPPGRAQPHRRPVAAATGADDAVRDLRPARRGRVVQDAHPRRSSTTASPGSTRAWRSRSRRDVLRAGYYAEIDLMGWAQQRYGAEFAAWLGDAYEPIDPVVRLAERRRRRAAPRRRVRRPGVVGAGVARQPRRRLLPRGRRRDPPGLRRLRRRVAGGTRDAT